jgi:hypothetical protein
MGTSLSPGSIADDYLTLLPIWQFILRMVDFSQNSKQKTIAAAAGKIPGPSPCQ